MKVSLKSSIKVFEYRSIEIPVVQVFALVIE